MYPFSFLTFIYEFLFLFQILAPRLGYLPLLASQIKPHFSSTLPPGVDTIWFEYKGLPLKWYIPYPYLDNCVFVFVALEKALCGVYIAWESNNEHPCWELLMSSFVDHPVCDLI